MLFTKQIELALKIFRASGSANNLIVLLSSESEHQDEARDDLRELVPDLTQLSYEAAMLYPVEVYGSFKSVSEALVDVISAYDEGRDIKASVDALLVADVRWALMARALIGVDELSIESLKLHSKKSELTRLDSVEADVIRSHFRQAKDSSPGSSSTDIPTQLD